MRSSLRIIVSGLIAQHYTLGGVAWDYIQYLIGLKSLGHDVWYLEDSGEWPYNLDGGPTGNDWVAYDCVNNIEYLKKVFAHAQLEDRWAYYFPTRSEWYGLSDVKREDILSTADLLINVSGSLQDPGRYGHIPKRIYIDSDPAFTQVKIKSKSEFKKQILEHNAHFSFGEKLPQDLTTPDITWLPTRTPIDLSYWNHLKTGNNYTTVMNWTSYPPLQFEGKKYGQKDQEFEKFLLLPQLTNMDFELALSKTQHKNWQSNFSEHLNGTFNSPKDLLIHNGWKVVDPQEKCHDMFSYREYIENSKAEWSIAKNGYVVARPGWFSCRSACYLAAGKPVIVQDTGFPGIIPTGKGVHAFNTIDDVIAALDQVESDYNNECVASREIAREYFSTDVVLSKLVDTAYSNSPNQILTT